MVEFGQKYTDAWNSKQPEKMASFYTENGTGVNDQIKLLFVKTENGWKLIHEHHSPLKKE